MKLFIHRNLRKNRTDEELDKIQSLVVDMVENYQNLCHGKMFYDSKGLSCVYANNVLARFKTRESGVSELKEIIDYSTRFFSAANPSFRNIDGVDKKIVLHPEKSRKKHFLERYITRNFSFEDILSTVGYGIRIQSQDGSVFYFKDNSMIVTSETDNEIRITTAINVSMFSEKNLSKIIPSLQQKMEKDLGIDVIVSLRDNYRFIKWTTSPECIALDRVLYNINNEIGGTKYRKYYSERNIFGKSRIEQLYDDCYSKADKLMVYYFSYPYKEMVGHLPLENIKHNIPTTSYDVIFTVKDIPNSLSVFREITTYLERFGLDHYIKFKNHEDLIKTQKDPINKTVMLSIDASAFTRNNDERFNTTTDLEYILNYENNLYKSA